MDDFEIIGTYTRKQAFLEGEQFDIDSITPGLREEARFLYPIFITKSIKNIIDESTEYGCNQVEGVIWDILMVLHYSIKRCKGNARILDFKIKINWKNNRSKNFNFLAEVGPVDIDNPAPAITIMLPEER